MRPGDLKLHHLGPEVVGVTVQPYLRLEPDAELVAALAPVRVRLHAQRVEVVNDVAVVVVVRQVADREVHLGDHLATYRWIAASAAMAK